PRALEHGRTVVSARREELHADDELSGRQRSGEPRFVLARHARHVNRLRQLLPTTRRSRSIVSRSPRTDAAHGHLDLSYVLGRRPVERIPAFLGRHLRDDRRAGHAAYGGNRGTYFVEIAEGLEDEEVDAAGSECLRLLTEVLFGLVHAGLAPRLDPDPKRP